jgi:hypothetical protein
MTSAPNSILRASARIQSYVGRLPPVKNWQDAVGQMKLMFGTALPDYSDAQWLEFARTSFSEDGQGVPRLMADPRIGDAVRAIPAPPGAAHAMWLAFGALHGVPTLGLRGVHSDLLSASPFERMQRENGHMLAVTVPNRGHPPQLNEPQSAAAIERFLATLE